MILLVPNPHAPDQMCCERDAMLGLWDITSSAIGLMMEETAHSTIVPELPIGSSGKPGQWGQDNSRAERPQEGSVWMRFVCGHESTVTGCMQWRLKPEYRRVPCLHNSDGAQK